MSFSTGKQEESLKYGVSRKIQSFYRREFGPNTVVQYTTIRAIKGLRSRSQTAPANNLLDYLITRPGMLPGSAIRNQNHLHPVIGGGNTIPFKGSYVLVSRRIDHMGVTVKMRNKFDAYTAVV